MRNLFGFLMSSVFLVLLNACQSHPANTPAAGGFGAAVSANSNKKNSFVIENFKFEKSITNDKKESGWKVMEYRPGQLPYNGAIAQFSAQERWIKLFEKAMEDINQECGKPISHVPEIRGDQTDYFKLGKSPQHPKLLRARFSCK